MYKAPDAVSALQYNTKIGHRIDKDMLKSLFEEKEESMAEKKIKENIF